MSAQPTYVLRCDEGDCPMTVAIPDVRALDEARMAAERLYGWTQRGTEDICHDHSWHHHARSTDPMTFERYEPADAATLAQHGPPPEPTES